MKYRVQPSTILYLNGGLCPCTKEQSRSRAENEIIKYIKSIYDGDVIMNNRQVISPYELDIYLPDINLAIEYNGLYWHSKITNENITDEIHQFKIKLCLEKGIRLIQIFDKDWKSSKKKETIKKVLKILINNPNKYINEDLRWGIPLTEQSFTINKPEKIYLKYSRIVKTEEESNNYTYLCGTFTK